MNKEFSAHTIAEGQRVHWLANLGGLVTIAGLDAFEPAILLGAFIEINAKLKQVSKERIAELKEKGLQALQARNTEKRTFKSWQRAQQTERYDLTQGQQKQLIVKLGGKIPVLEKDIAAELRRLLRGLAA